MPEYCKQYSSEADKVAKDQLNKELKPNNVKV